jgi:hypothetical protein
MSLKIAKYLAFTLITGGIFFSCSHRSAEPKEEQIRLDTLSASTDTLNSIQGNLSLQQIGTFPNNVVLTGLKEHRLVTVYKTRKAIKTDAYGSSSYYYNDGRYEDDRYQHFMPGIDLLYGYNLLNLAHYDLKSEKMNFLFEHPVLIKSVYYPSFEQDSIDKKPVNRDYYFVSVYDADTNRDTLINKKDLRNFYYFNSSGSERIQLIPEHYSAVRSEYDHGNDLMYIFAKEDKNRNGTPDKDEPTHIFWIDLKLPTQSKRLY